MGWTFYNASGQRLSTATTLITNLDIDGATDIGAAIVDADLFIIDDGAGGTNRKTAASRIKTYVEDAAGEVPIANLDIDGGTDIGAAIVDADLFIIDDGAGGTNRKTAASRIKTYVGAAPSQAVQADIEAETNEDTYIPPDLIKHSPGVAKAWIRIPTDGASITSSYNTASLTDVSAGTRTWVIATDFSDDTWCPVGGITADSNTAYGVGSIGAIAVGSTSLVCRSTDANTPTDVLHSHSAFGDQ